MSKNNETRYVPTRELRVTRTESGERTISGIIPYNSPSQDMGFIEYIKPGAFAGALKPGADVLCLRDHDPKLLMGRTTSGTLVLSDSPTGLNFRCTLPSTQAASELAESIGRGDLDGVSFGMAVTKDEWKDIGGGKVTRTLLAVTLGEISPCSFPAYRGSNVSVRSCPKELRSLLGSDYDQACDDPDCEACQNGDFADCPNQNDDETGWAERSLLLLELAKRK